MCGINPLDVRGQDSCIFVTHDSFQGIRLWKISTRSGQSCCPNPGGAISTEFCAARVACVGVLIENCQGSAHGLLRQERGGRQKETRCEPGDKAHYVSRLCLDFMLSSSDSVVFQKGPFSHSFEGKLVKSKTRGKITEG